MVQQGFLYLVMCVGLLSFSQGAALQAQEGHVLVPCLGDNIHSEQDFFDVCMELWAGIDLVQAINADQELKQNVAAHCYDRLLKLSRALVCNKRTLYRSVARSYTIDTLSVMIALKAAFENVFSKSGSPYYADALSLLDFMTLNLNTPANDEASLC